ncbi:proteasome maturation protein-like [Rousettus aegyptiacus]|uniref:proteasome maturation protein-like n=1 Tax=Rousettus aegyptiacus TaxID=9407 RepID=UPI00168D6415|nr:proteasome maturation protein-like [Rousettus aegyptiacus]XP_036075649.1 proteasome maturation protein-like [Rousettus aegyptiacus]XP_036075650.1 proteasome maturation protein-like [Rousettus aegyptiacus]XP_036075651.1 proteasome maturation protein-like [Rousettus aegyptiacus]XP_036075652.1 proteasome maturation protein-like [Rousettus aegyptiacus]XP_036075653.1 proteasome maturation protein-like [Rousettus aegyptiacus]XP_036075655.1 proteasome maturation protein-like [Rousettus aegyptiacu
MVRGLRGCLQSKLQMNARGLGSQLKDSIPVTELSASGPFESYDLLLKGFSSVKNELLPSHPLELSENNFQLNQDKMNLFTLRNIQSLFAPLKLQMKCKTVQQVQHLSFLPSSNRSLDILRGNDETIGFEDILNGPSQGELVGEPHLVEYKLGLL